MENNKKRVSLKKEYSTGEIQKVILSIIKDIDELCKKHDITYYLMSGSALGAMRHKGFIPWDDDLDIAMTLVNYEKFIEMFEKEMESKEYFLQRENTKEWPLFLSRVCLNGTTMISNEFKYNFRQHHTVFVDIKHLYTAPNSRILHALQYFATQLLRINALALCSFPAKSMLKRMILKLSTLMVNPVTKPILIDFIYRYESRTTKYVGYYFGRERIKDTRIGRDIIGEPRYVQFEDTFLPVFEKVEEYLKGRFGEKWMEIPSQDIINRFPSHSDFVDLEKDYTEYLDEDGKKWCY